MYTDIQNSLIEFLASKHDPRLLARKLNIGMALKQIKDLEEIPPREIIKKTGIKRTALDSILFQKECNTSFEKLTRITAALNVSLDEFIAIARETARYNFFILKRGEQPIFSYGRTHEVTVFSPPIFNQRDFIWALIRIRPDKRIDECLHPAIKQIACFVVNGHLRFRYGNNEHPVSANQSFFFDPRISHEFINEETEATTDFFIAYHLNPQIETKPLRGRKAVPAPFDTARFVNTIRQEISPSLDNVVSCNTLSQLSGVDYNSIAYLAYHKPKILFLEKIDALCALSPLPFERIIQKSENRYQGWLKVYTDQDKTTLDYRLNHGMRMNTHTAPGTGLRHFGISDIYFEPIQGLENVEKRPKWKFTDSSFLGLRVEKGVVGIQYGKQAAEKLYWGDTIYLNADVPVTFFNALTVKEAEKEKQSPEVKITVFSHPPLV